MRNLQEEFASWLIEKGASVKLANDTVSRVASINLPLESPKPNVWNGLYEALHGKRALKTVFEVNGDEDFMSIYGVLFKALQASLTENDVKRFKDCFDWAHAPDNHNAVRAAIAKYRQFLQEYHGDCDGPYQLITYGAPGTGKSFRTKEETKGHVVYRTTFHPDSDYSTFVGAYKPTMSDDAGRIEVYKGSGQSRVLDVTHEVKKGISYDFVPQAFIKAYIDAWQKMNAVVDGGTPEPVFLVIEEINRGNCAQIFGDLFQLLDRDDDGYSDYPIDTDADLKRFLSAEKQLGNLFKIPEEVRTGVKLVMPPNLYIRATMNTSDQSLFPIDSAFKRRWEWKYVPIAKPTEAGWKDRVIVADGKAYDWWEFLLLANKQILDTTKSEDKQLGYFFVKAPDATGHIKADRFAGKVLFYLYNDVFKDYSLPPDLFGDGSGASTKYEFKMFFDEHGETKEDVVAAFLEQLGLVATPVNPV